MERGERHGECGLECPTTRRQRDRFYAGMGSLRFMHFEGIVCSECEEVDGSYCAAPKIRQRVQQDSQWT